MQEREKDGVALLPLRLLYAFGKEGGRKSGEEA
jgi:hypothetical protein